MTRSGAGGRLRGRVPPPVPSSRCRPRRRRSRRRPRTRSADREGGEQEDGELAALHGGDIIAAPPGGGKGSAAARRRRAAGPRGARAPSGPTAATPSAPGRRASRSVVTSPVGNTSSSRSVYWIAAVIARVAVPASSGSGATLRQPRSSAGRPPVRAVGGARRAGAGLGHPDRHVAAALAPSAARRRRRARPRRRCRCAGVHARAPHTSFAGSASRNSLTVVVIGSRRTITATSPST